MTHLISTSTTPTLVTQYTCPALIHAVGIGISPGSGLLKSALVNTDGDGDGTVNDGDGTVRDVDGTDIETRSDSGLQIDGDGDSIQIDDANPSDLQSEADLTKASLVDSGTCGTATETIATTSDLSLIHI